MHADWQEVWHSPQPPVAAVCFKVGLLITFTCFMKYSSLHYRYFRRLDATPPIIHETSKIINTYKKLLSENAPGKIIEPSAPSKIIKNAKQTIDVRIFRDFPAARNEETAPQRNTAIPAKRGIRSGEIVSLLTSSVKIKMSANKMTSPTKHDIRVFLLKMS